MKQLSIPGVGRQRFSLAAWLRENNLRVTKNPQDGHPQSARWVAMIEASGDIHSSFGSTRKEAVFKLCLAEGIAMPPSLSNPAMNTFLSQHGPGSERSKNAMLRAKTRLRQAETTEPPSANLIDPCPEHPAPVAPV